MPDRDPADILKRLDTRLGELGLILRGGFLAEDEDGAPENTRTVLMIGNAGPDLWRQSAGNFRDEPNAMDEWTRRVIDPLGREVGASAVLYPFGGPPYHPFQRWAKRAEGLHSSPLGMLIHPKYGLWHAYRAALCFDRLMPLPEMQEAPENPCDTCAGQPCLNACPVSAFSAGQAYDVPACVAHLRTAAGEDCLSLGCRARRACPLGRDHVYDPGQAAFHMQAFLQAR